ncbi:MAG: DEAD/DEAH box helicase, partial [Gammaproteobacteria bacterium]|nr:DEAD/DEAH box helicase [Gammaproteobacteria bacterium]
MIDQQADYLFHPVVEQWFTATFNDASECQRQAWPAVQSGADTLIAAPTGSGKTLAAFLSAIDSLVRRSLAGGLEERTYVVYVSPLKALSNDIQRNLEAPLSAISALLEERGLADHGIRTAVRTGDTPQAARAAMRRRPPHILVTTPESLYILLTSDSGRGLLKGAGTVIVDEIHAVVNSKRGAHLALTLARLDALSGQPAGPWDRPGRAQRIGLSATQRPIEMVAGFLTGAEAAGTPRPCRIIDTGHVRQWDIALEMPASPLEAVASADQAAEMYDRLAELIETHSTTLVFVNTRRLAERLARALSERLGEEHITSHHGSMARDKRLSAERRLKNGELKALVATASLELGIDIGDVDLVCQIGATRTLSTLLQRVGRSGHGIGRIPRGRLFPQTRDDLVTCAALLDMSRRAELDTLIMPEAPLDVLAQQLVAEAACDEYDEDSLFTMYRGAYPYRAMRREDFDAVMRSLGEGYSTALGRRGAWLHRDRVNGRVAARRGARLSAVTCGGAIPDNADYDVIAEPEGQLVGTVNEDFAIESMPGNIFQLGNTSWRVLRVEALSLRVADAAGEPPNIPFWIGEAPARSEELSLAVSRLREEFTRRVEAGAGSQDTMIWLMDEVGLDAVAAQQIDTYLRTARAALGTLPTQDTLVLERFFDESDAMQLVIHSPFGSRINRGFGLALRKRFCRSFNFELQAAATDDAIVISLGPVHSFPLDDVWRFLDRQSVRDVLTQALLDAPMFPVRWRWNASCALAILRFRGGSRVAPRLQRMNADDLLALVFPDQLACAENLTGRREVPDHPLVAQTIHDCLTEAMDIDGLETLVDDIRSGRKRLRECDLTEPSPLAMEVLNANPYAFLDDAPLEERRTHAVHARRWLDVDTAGELGQLDGRAIERVRDEVWPAPRNDDEMHDALVTAGFLLEAEITGTPAGSGWRALFDQLVDAGRATVVSLAGDMPRIMVAAERLAEVHAALDVQALAPALQLPECLQGSSPDAAAALAELLRSRLEI